MSGFASAWLELREPADHRAVNGYVRSACVRALAGTRPVRVVDLGCGTGSNLRGLAPSLGPAQQWTLVDNDPVLLEAARSALAPFERPRAPAPTPPDVHDGAARELEVGLGDAVLAVALRAADLARCDLGEILAGHDLVTASALFDLVSADLVEKLAEAVAACGPVFYAVLTYDGIAAWLPEHPADADMRAAFNRHQRSDKGFGPALGPAAAETLAGALAAHGYRIVRAKSPWVLDRSFQALREEVDRGWAQAAAETGLVPPATVAGWLQHRLSRPDAVTVVGHEDLLALPPGR